MISAAVLLCQGYVAIEILRNLPYTIPIVFRLKTMLLFASKQKIGKTIASSHLVVNLIQLMKKYMNFSKVYTKT